MPAMCLKNLFIVFFGLTCLCTISAQTKKATFFIGLNPSITVEPYYQKGELDLNVFPLVYQLPLVRILDLRITSILNLGIRNSGNSITNLGIETALPIYFKRKENRLEYSKGFYLAPIICVTRNRAENHTNTGIWLEPGYHLLFDTKFAMSFGLQLGTTYFRYDDAPAKFGNHFGLKIIFGRWL